MQVTVRFFASLRESTGARQQILTLSDDAKLTDLIDVLLSEYPALSAHQASWHFAINQTHAEPDAELKDGDRVAIFPYIAGG